MYHELAVYAILCHRAATEPSTINTLALIYFLLYYADYRTTFIQVGAAFETYLQSDSLDQGEACASHFFGDAFATAVSAVLRHLASTATDTYIHDDLTLSDYTIPLPLDPTASPIPTTIADATAITAPLAFAIHAIITHALPPLRLVLASTKTHIFQPPLPPDHPATASRLAHLFPPGTSFSSTHFILAGTPIYWGEGFRVPLLASLTSYRDLLRRLLDVPAISPQLRLLLLTASCRPSAVHGLPLRNLPPSILIERHLSIPADFHPAVPTDTPFTIAARRLLHHALATCLRLPPDTFLASTLDFSTAIQLALQAAEGGVGLPDTSIIAPAAFLGATADTHRLLLADHVLAPAISAHHDYPTSTSAILREAHHHFYDITALPSFAALAYATSFCPDATPTKLIAASTGKFDIALLPTVASRHSQRTFSRARLAAFLDAALATDHPHLTTTARARLRLSAAPLAHHLFHAYYIPPTSALTPSQLQFLYLHRLGVGLPFIPSPPPATCAPKCRSFPPSRPIPPTNYLHPLLVHAYHHCSCGAGPYRHRRHDLIAKLIAAAARNELTATIDLKERLCSDSKSGKKVDIVVTAYDAVPPITAIDVTVSCALLDSYVSDASKDGNLIFAVRAKEKNEKHLAGCVDLERAFLPIVFTTHLGIGPSSAREWLDSLFTRSYLDEIAAGGSGCTTAHRRLIFYQSLQTVLVRVTTDMIQHLTSRAPPPADDA